MTDTDTDTIPRSTVPVVEEDPRIAARRLGVAGAVRRRRTIVLGVVAGLLGLVALGVGLLRSPLFAVERVVVTGATTIDRSAVIAASRIHRGDALVDVDAARTRTAVMAMPMVASARVERSWPHEVRISVTEEVPLATFVVGGRQLTVGRGGRILAAASAPAAPAATASGATASGATASGAASGAGANLPRVVVADGVSTRVPPVGKDLPDALAAVVVVVEQLPPLLAGRLQEVDLAVGGSMSIELRDGAGRVALGSAEDVPSKLLAAESILAAVDLDCLDLLDVSEPSHPTVSRRGGCALAPPTAPPR
ncbi:MAG: FtsQ-type POTRA domain-containing protein [Actinobacteria bacterium]|nr:FtsQ-type POTRA domain-containing protein [Actinomycetota bacterium]